ncbi:hypothetical protein OH492_18970 [Vibrio chagasii]|nr:hypothetical protein [Vibrio chagasii]
MLITIDVLGYYLDLTGSPAMRSSQEYWPLKPRWYDGLNRYPLWIRQWCWYLVVEKRSDKPEYTEDDDSVTYYLCD